MPRDDGSDRTSLVPSEGDALEVFRSLFEGAAVGLARVDPDGGIVLANERFATMLGVPPEALEALTLPDLLGAGERSEAWTRWRAVLDGTSRCCRVAVHPAGSGRAVAALSCRVVRDVGGNPSFVIATLQPLDPAADRDAQEPAAGVLGMAPDLDARRRPEQALRDSEALHRHLFEAMDEGLVIAEPVFDAAGAVIDIRNLAANPAVAAHTGLAFETFVGRTARELIGSIEPEWLDMAARVARGGPPESREGYVGALDRWFHVHAFGVGSGRFAALFSDVTRRQRALVETEESRARLAAVLESLVEGVVIADPVGRVLEMNPAALALHDFIGREEAHRQLLQYADLFELRSLDGAVLPLHEWPLARILRGETLVDLEVELVRKDLGRSTVVQYSGRPVRDASGEIALCVMTMTDVTERRRIEEDLWKFRFFSDNANDGLVLIDERGRIRYANRLFCDRLGYRESELLALGMGDIDPYVAGDMFDLFEQCKDGRVPPFESVHRRRDGSEFPVEVTATALCFQGEWLMFGASRDISDRKRGEMALRDSEEQLGAIFEHAAVGILYTTLPERRIVRVNQTFCRILGYTRDELLGVHVPEVLHPDDRMIGGDQYAQLEAGVISSFTVDKRYLSKDGRVVWARTTPSALRDEAGIARFAIAVVEDITDAKLVDRSRRDAERRLQLAVGIAELGFWEWHAGNRTLYLSPQWKKQLGYDEHELTSALEEFTLRLDPADRDRVVDEIARYLREPMAELVLEYRLVHRDGSSRWFVARAIPFGDDSGRAAGLLGTQLDVTDRKLAEQRIREVALHDPLTGLPNRALLFEYGQRLLATARRGRSALGVLFIDLDRFKPINDSHGHEMGDKVLREVARRLALSVRAEDLVGRLGGDEFLVVLNKVHSEQAVARTVAHLVTQLAKPYTIDGHELETTPSIGVALFPGDGNDLDTLVKNADVAMYHAKEAGRGRFQFFTSEMDAHAAVALATERQLRDAIERHGFDLEYQPIVDAHSGRVTGVEALLRWQRGNLQHLAPAQFIPVAESSGLIVAMGRWVMREICRQHAAWCEDGLPPLRISMNVSPSQFGATDFRQSLLDATSEYGIDPGYLELELSEGAVMRQLETSGRLLASLKDLGVKISIDDFGTGFTNLSELSKLPIDRLKVDQSMVREVATDERALAAADGLIALGRRLGVEVVAEGVESARTLAMLRERDCDAAQGYYFTAPLPPALFADWYRRHEQQGGPH